MTMKTITINRQTINVTAMEERALRRLARANYVAAMSDFDEGPRRHLRNPFRISKRSSALLGVDLMWGDPKTPAQRRLCAERPRLRNIIVGDKRRINLIIKKLGD